MSEKENRTSVATEAEMQERYARQLMLPEIGPEGQRRLTDARVLVVGLGGLGAPVTTYLAGAGVGCLGLVDADTVSVSNLQRQVLYTQAQVGLPKVYCAAQRLRAINPSLVTDCHHTALTPGNAPAIIGGYDLVVDCCDNFATRYLVDETCAALGKTWIYGSIGAFHGQVAVMNGKAGLRYTTLYPDRPALEERGPSRAGVIGVVPAVVGALQAAEAIKTIVGFGDTLDGRLFTIDLKTLNTNILEF